MPIARQHPEMPPSGHAFLSPAWVSVLFRVVILGLDLGDFRGLWRFLQDENQSTNQTVHSHSQEKQKSESNSLLRINSNHLKQKKIASFAQPETVETDRYRRERSDQGIDDDAVRKGNLDMDRSTQNQVKPGLNEMNNERNR